MMLKTKAKFTGFVNFMKCPTFNAIYVPSIIFRVLLEFHNLQKFVMIQQAMTIQKYFTSQHQKIISKGIDAF